MATEFPDSIKDYGFDLPESLIAQEPSAQRDAARLLVVRRNPARGLPQFEDLHVSDLPQFAAQELPKSLWVRNRSRVMPARFYAKRASGSVHEIVLLEETKSGIWKALMRKQARMDFPQALEVGGEKIVALDRDHIDLRGLKMPLGEFLDQHGEMPLPPYIKNRIPARDKERYQSIWADTQKDLSVAAPTASLHFTPQVLNELELKAQVEWADLFLHVGLGTFEPVREELLSRHHLHSERLEVHAQDLEKIQSFAGPRVSVGTTALRTLESLPMDGNHLRAELYEWERQNDRYLGRTRIFIKGGYEFRYTDALFTNFHLPESTLFVLVSAFAQSLTLAKEAYAHAIQKQYRFFSYGDASIWV